MTRMRRYIAICVVGACSVFGVSVALASAHHTGHHSQKVGVHFAVLTHRAAKSADLMARGELPSSAVLAANVGDNKVYVFQRSVNLVTQVCIADEFTKATAIACSTNAAAEREGVDLMMNLGSAPSIVVLVPNGVSHVIFSTQSGATTSVTVVNNVAVIESSSVASYHYLMPTGVERSVTTQQG